MEVRNNGVLSERNTVGSVSLARYVLLPTNRLGAPSVTATSCFDRNAESLWVLVLDRIMISLQTAHRSEPTSWDTWYDSLADVLWR